ncbi:hypothetical protein ACHAO9_011841 [Fusarium lateritium]
MRKVYNTLPYAPTAVPTNPKVWDLPLDEDGRIPILIHDDVQAQAVEHFMYRMDVHRALLRGKGYFDVIVNRKKRPEDLIAHLALTSLESQPEAHEFAELPWENFLAIEDKRYADCIVNEALPQDRVRFRGFLSAVFLGLGLTTAPPGFGKTTAGAAAALAMQAKVGQVLCSAPTNVAVDNFSGCINKRTHAIAARYNKGKAPDHVSRCRHRLVVRAYSPSDEVAAFRNLLEKPYLGDTAAKSGQFVVPSHWKLHLSLAYWVLILLRSPAVPAMDIDDSKALHDLQQAVDKETDLSQLQQVASGEISWEEYSKTQDPNGTIQNLMSRVLNIADFLCTTPANAQREPFSIWANERAKGLGVNEAGNMHRADLYGVWGNTLLPCFLIGDPRQSPPVMTIKDVDANNNLVNRFAEDGRVSPMAFFQGTGHPVYRLKTQLRMA